jgi:hypothetical protein
MMVTQSDIGSWQQVAAWEKSIAEERNIAPSPPKLNIVRGCEKSTDDLSGHNLFRDHRKLDEI